MELKRFSLYLGNVVEVLVEINGNHLVTLLSKVAKVHLTACLSNLLNDASRKFMNVNGADDEHKPVTESAAEDGGTEKNNVTIVKDMLNEHKGKLAVGAAATLGMLVFYGWRQRQLSKEDPEEFAKQQRLIEAVISADEQKDGRQTKKKTERNIEPPLPKP